MNKESLELLEYESWRALARRYVASDLGKRLLDGTQPSTDRVALEAALAEALEAIDLLTDVQKAQARGAQPPSQVRFDGLPDPTAAVARLRIEGSVLDPLEITAITGLLERAAEVRLSLAPLGARFPLLSQRASRIGDFRKALREVSGKILPDGSVADHASVALARIRRDIERQRRNIHESLERFLKQHRDDGLLQDEFVTLRNDRFVVPVIPGAKRKVPGVIHGSSGSGQTLFVEPLETIDLNNDLVRLGEEELREVHRILRELTSRLREHAAEVRETAVILGELDVVFAKARFSMDFRCAVPRFTSDEEPRLALKDARHPLLEDVLKRQRKRVVPVSLSLDGFQRTLLISGPNTGGKTVSMKTVGLLALMAQSGWPVPAEDAELPIFEDVLADIGDNQSIEQSLSSFSSHVERVKAMLAAARSGALVLLDELGRATDPEEGGALGVAILDEFRSMGCFTLASTHLLALKVYGSNTNGVLNASMGFNETTLEPTYVLRTGAPGKSAGLDIATRLGLPSPVIEKARASMSTTERDIARFLNELERKTSEVADEAAELERQKRAVDEREKALIREMEKREAARLREIEQQVGEAQKRFEAQAQATIESVLAAPEQRKKAERALRQVASTKREFREAIQTIAQGGKPKPQAAKEQIVEGARVRLRDVGQPAKVLKVINTDLIEVEVGLLKMQVAVNEVTQVLPASDAPGGRLPKGVTFNAGPRWDTLAREINVIGKTAEEAESDVERFLDSAVLAEVTRIRVVHGHGMGVLRKTVQRLLSRHPLVERHYPAPQNEGGSGATIVELKAD